MKTPAPQIWLQPMTTGRGAAASFAVAIAGLPVGKKLTAEFFEVDPPAQPRDQLRKQASGDVALGKVPGTVTLDPLGTQMQGAPRFVLKPDGPPPAPPPADAPFIEFYFPGTAEPFAFVIPDEALDIDEGDFWELQVRAADPVMASPIATVAHVRRSLVRPAAAYHWHEGHDLVPYHDGATDADGSDGAFADMMKAIDGAKHFVFVVDWSFHPFFRPNLGKPSIASTIGATLLAKAAKGLTVAIHTWDHTNFAAKDTQNDDGDDWLRALSGSLGVPVAPTFRWRAGSPAGISLSHHQKFVLVDQEAQDGRRTFRVFFGGLDLTQGRLDWPEHPVATSDATLKSRRFSWGTSPRYLTNEWYNGETGGDLALPRQPWHDIHGRLDGPATWDFLREFVIRWASHPGSQSGDGLAKVADPVCDLWKTVRDRDKWVQQDEPATGPWAAQMLRSNTSDRCAVAQQIAPPDSGPLHLAMPSGHEASILEMYRQAIDQADRFIYIENQYLIGSGNIWGREGVVNDLPERIVKKIISKKGKPFHVYITTPMFPEGDPVSTGGVEIRNYEWRTIQYMINALSAEFGTRWTDYLSLFFLANWHLVDRAGWSSGDRNDRLRAHQRYMVYVHSKLMIVDDRFMIFGSANLNERSLAGDRDTEIACALWPGRGQEATCIEQLRGFRKALMAEHFGAAPPGAADPASAACWGQCQSVADVNYLSFRLMQSARQGHACRLPVQMNKGNLTLGLVANSPVKIMAAEPLDFLPDGIETSNWWRWTCRGSRLSFALGTAAE